MQLSGQIFILRVNSMVIGKASEPHGQDNIQH